MKSLQKKQEMVASSALNAARNSDGRWHTERMITLETAEKVTHSAPEEKGHLSF